MKNYLRRITLIGYLLFVVSWLSSFFVMANEEVTTTSADKNELIYISVASIEIPPMLFKDEQGKLQGTYIDLLKRAEQISNLRFKVHLMPWARALNEVKHNRVDAIMPALYSDERATYLAYPKKNLFIFGNSVLLKRSNDTFKFDSISTIGKDRIIGKVRSTRLDEEFVQAERTGAITIVGVIDFEKALEMLAKKRLDLVVIDSEVAKEIMTRLKIQNQFIAIPLVAKEVKSYLSFSKVFAKHHDIDEIIESISRVK